MPIYKNVKGKREGANNVENGRGYTRKVQRKGMGLYYKLHFCLVYQCVHVLYDGLYTYKVKMQDEYQCYCILDYDCDRFNLLFYTFVQLQFLSS